MHNIFLYHISCLHVLLTARFSLFAKKKRIFICMYHTVKKNIVGLT